MDAGRAPSYASQVERNLGHLTPEQRAAYEATIARMMAGLPYERVTVAGAAALEEWERLRSAGRGMPVIVGGDEELERIAEQYTLDDPAVFGSHAYQQPLRPAAQILEAAAGLAFPASLSGWAGGYEEEDLRAPLGDWPAATEAVPGLTVASDVLSNAPFERVHILLIPADANWKVPAYLRWGGWNACPPPEYHVSALRSWYERYGAELIGLNGDTMNLRVARKPATRDEAVALAREQYRYCPDIVDQGVATLNALAATLMDSDWWYFWWD